MKTLWLKLTLKDDVVFSARTASLGLHECLDYIPGSALLGSAAGALYRGLGALPAWTAFHSGQVRFGCARPWRDRETVWPLPRSWHHPKGVAVENDSDGRYIAANLVNLACGEWPSELGQSVQFRAGWFGESGACVQVERAYRMKTAVDASLFDRPGNEQLFGYASIAAGSAWLARVSADDAVPDEVWGRVAGYFDGRTLRLGRSRKSEYGRTECARLGPKEAPSQAQGLCTGAYLRFFAVSDLALLDSHGQPTLAPKPCHFDLPGGDDDWELVPERTFIGTRRYSPYNFYRNAFDLERQVLVKGSVVTFVSRRRQPVSPKEFADIEAGVIGGVGAHRQDGLGEVLLNPSWLLSSLAAFSAPAKGVRADHATSEETRLAGQTANGPHSVPPDGTARGMRRRFEERQLAHGALHLGRQWGREWSQCRGGPSKSQWARLREEAARARPSESESARQALARALRAEVFTRSKWAAPYLDSQLSQVIVQSLEGEAADNALRKELIELEVDVDDGNASGLLDRLAVAACREAAIEAARRLNQKGSSAK